MDHEWKRDYSLNWVMVLRYFERSRKRRWLTYILYVRVGYYDLQYYLHVRADEKKKQIIIQHIRRWVYCCQCKYLIWRDVTWFLLFLKMTLLHTKIILKHIQYNTVKPRDIHIETGNRGRIVEAHPCPHVIKKQNVNVDKVKIFYWNTSAISWSLLFVFLELRRL